MRDHGPGGSHRRAGALLLVPVAAFTIAATTLPSSAVASTPEEPPAASYAATIDGVLVVGWTYEGSTYWASSEDGAHFARAQRDHPPPQSSEGCVPSEPSVCFRVAPGNAALESSPDGGVTWTAERLAWPNFSSDSGARISLAVVEHDGEYRVVVPLGYAGFAVRAPDGTWSTGQGLGGAAAGALDAAAFGSLGLAIAALAAALAAALFCFALAVLALLSRGPTGGVRWVGAAWVVTAIEAVGLGLYLAIATPLNATRVPISSGFEWTSATYGTLFLAAASSLTLAYLGAFDLRPEPGARRRLLLASAFVGLAVGAAPAVPWPGSVSEFSMAPRSAVVAAVALIIAAAYVALGDQRRRAGVRG